MFNLYLKSSFFTGCKVLVFHVSLLLLCTWTSNMKQMYYF